MGGTLVENSAGVVADSFMSAGEGIRINSPDIIFQTRNKYAEEESVDPFETFSRPDELVHFEVPLSKELVDEFIGKRIMLLECQHRDVLDSVFDRLARRVHDRFSGYSLIYKRHEPSEVRKGGGANKSSLKKVFLNPQKLYQQPEEKKLLFAKVILSEQGRFFIEPVLKVSGISEEITEWRSLLTRQHIFLVFIVNDASQLLKKEDLVKLRPVLVHKKFPFLPYLLKQHIGSEHIPAIRKALHVTPEAEHEEEKNIHFYLNVLEDQIDRQRKNGQWSGNENDFYTQVYNYIRNAPEELLLEVGRKGNHDQHAESAPILEKIARQFEAPQKRIFQTVYFTGVYFPKLKLREFVDLVDELLDGYTYKDPPVKETVHAEGQPGKQVFEEKIIDCKQVWREDSDHFLRLCFLQPTYTESDQQTIEFRYNYLRAHLKNTLEQEHPSFIQHQFNQLYAPVLIKNDASSSSKVIENYIEFSVELAKSDPQFYGIHLLNCIKRELREIKNAKNQKKARQEENQTSGTPDYALDREIEALEDDNNILANRLSYLLRLMLATPELVSTQRHFLTSLVDPRTNRQVDALHNATLLDVVKRLHDNKEFDALHWLKELIYQGQETARVDAYIFLLFLLYTRDESPGEELEKIYSWIPQKQSWEDPGSGGEYTGSEWNALVPFYLSMWGVADLKETDLGAVPSAFPLFAHYQTPEEAEKDFIFLLNWLFHPAVFSEKEGLRTKYFNFRYKTLDTIVHPFDVLEKWYMVLNGFHAGPANPYAEAFLRSLAACCKEKAGLKKNMIKTWLDKRNFYLLAINYHSQPSYRIFREMARQRRNLLNDLIERTRPL